MCYLKQYFQFPKETRSMHGEPQKAFGVALRATLGLTCPQNCSNNGEAQQRAEVAAVGAHQVKCLGLFDPCPTPGPPLV